MILVGFSLVAVFCAIFAAFSSDIKRAILALWVCGLGMGAVFLGLGMEFLAVIQWIVSTLVAVAFVFFLVMFGEFEQRMEGVPREPKRVQNKIERALPLGLGAVFCVIFVMALEQIKGSAEKIDEILKGGVVSGVDLSVFGKVFMREHFLSLQVLALMLLLVIVGGGVIARPEAPRDNKEGI
ncbi:NADH-quinone oxidoreductase subunit J [Bdellovibrionota bacterium FG-2]